MLDQVTGQLLEQRLLVVPVVGSVSWGEVEEVLVRRVDPADRDSLPVIHLLGELAGELDRLDVRAKGATEHALEQGLQRVLDSAQYAHA